MFSDTAKNSAFSDAAAFSGAQKTSVPRPPYSHDRSVFSDTAKSQRSVTLQRLVTLSKDVHLAFTQPRQVRPCLVTRQETRRSVTPQSLVALSKDVHPGITAMTSWCLVTRQKSQRSVTLQRLATLRKHVHPGIDTATTSPCLVTRPKCQRSVTLPRLVAPENMFIPAFTQPRQVRVQRHGKQVSV